MRPRGPADILTAWERDVDGVVRDDEFVGAPYLFKGIENTRLLPGILDVLLVCRAVIEVHACLKALRQAFLGLGRAVVEV